VPTTELLARWLVAFVITQAVECPIYVRVFRVRLAVAFGASTITHPFVCFVFPWLWRSLYLAFVSARPSFALSPDAYFFGYGVLAEGFAVLVEAFYLARVARLGGRRALVASIAANSASGLSGLLCSYLTGWP
jgi:hypothetical protein